ncbi:MAG: O-antigen ligase family protein [Methylococcales bacterium]|nr:O-antigen ligase family protein [Methylococcales bacterium]
MKTKLSSVINVEQSAYYENVIIVISVSLFPLFYLMQKAWVNAFVFILFAVAVIHFLRLTKFSWNLKNITLIEWAVVLSLCAGFLAILISQLFRLSIMPKPFDGPLRMFLCAPVFLLLLKKKLSFMSVFQYILPLSLVIFWSYCLLPSTASPMWVGRFGTSFVDPNTLGVNTLLLTSMCIFSIDAIHKDGLGLRCLKYAGVLAGLYLLYKSETRGAWLALPIMLLLWVNIHGKSKSKWVLIGGGVLVFIGIISLYIFDDAFHNRVISAYTELSGWLTKTNTDTSAGLRLSFWQMSWILFKQSPLYGYGDLGYQVHLSLPQIKQQFSQSAIDQFGHIGSHSEYLANMVRSGVLGLIAVLAEFLVPAIIFNYGLKSSSHEVKNTSAVGLSLVLGMMICGLSLEVLNLKYTNSFYGLMIACLCATVLWQRPARGEY